MACTELFLLLYETADPPTRYVRMVSEATEANEAAYLAELRFYVGYFETENCERYYDSLNITSHLSAFDNESYPSVRTRLHQILEGWDDLKEHSEASGSFRIFGHEEISGHIFCKIAGRQHDNNANTYLILNHDALRIQSETIDCSLDGLPISLKALPLNRTHEWFAANRRPMRKYNPAVEHGHGENGRGNKPNKSPLLCSHREAEEMMHKAIKDDKALLWRDDSRSSHIVFESENTYYNSYHAFHTNEPPKHIKNSKAIKDMIDRLLPA
ncbi:MAG: hypothetical protein LBD21_02155 [Tannerellaceae bacterium]|jgi:hypothetical protein|nr:hypothetical protein [Tannerellaceae bacterium]